MRVFVFVFVLLSIKTAQIITVSSPCTCDTDITIALQDIKDELYHVLLSAVDDDNAKNKQNGSYEASDSSTIPRKEWSTVQKATDEIVRHVLLTHVNHYREPQWHFADEKIHEGHQLLLRLQRKLLSILVVKDAPDYRACREILGQIVHLVLAFYTNTNWINMFPTHIYKNLGQPVKPLFPVAPPSIPTCDKCSTIGSQRQCHPSLLVHHFLTSGYFPPERKETLDMKETRPDGKCLHGAHAFWRNEVSKGIGDNVTGALQCPRSICQRQSIAANLTMQHIRYYLTDPDVGLFEFAEDIKLKRLLGSQPRTDIIYVDARDPLVKVELEKAVVNSKAVQTKAPNLEQACESMRDSSMFVLRVSENLLNDTIPDTCTRDGLDVHVIHVVQPNRASRHRRTYDNLDLYHLIASTSGGTVYETTKGNIGDVVDIIKDSIVSSNPVTVMKFNWTDKGNNSVEIPVDDQILNLTIKVQSSKLTSIYLYNPKGDRESFMNDTRSMRKFLGANLIIMKLFSPSPGLWRLERGTAHQCDVEVTGKSRMDFSYHFMQPGSGGIGEYPLVGRPIAGVNTSVQVSVPLVETVKSAERLVLLSEDGAVTATAPLHNVGGRRGATLFRTALVMPATEFKVAMEGEDNSGHVYRRLGPTLVSTLAIKLEVLPASGALYIKGSITIPYKVTNVGGAPTHLEVTIIDSLHLAQTPTEANHTLASGTSASGKFTLNAGNSKKGQTTTMTISAKAIGASHNKVQFYVQRITVEEKISKIVDSTPPLCNVTSTTGTCDVGVDVCACANNTWSMKVEFGDEEFGLQSVFASDTGSNFTFTNDSFGLGHLLKNGAKHAYLSTDCCHQKAKINVVDMAGNVGICNVTINPTLVAPDPKLCNQKPISTSGGSTSTVLSCFTTSVSGSCDFRNESCKDSCSPEDVCGKYNWTYTAHVGSESIGKIQAVPFRVDKRASLDVTDRTISLTTTCCHPSVIVRVIDFAGKIGECKGNIKITNSESVPTTSTTNDPAGSTPVGAIAGAVVAVVALTGVAVTAGILIKKKILCARKVVPKPQPQPLHF